MKKIFILVFAALTLQSCGFEVVDTGHRGIETRFGEVVGEPLNEGLHWYNPFTSKIIEYNVRQETWTSMTQIFTKDTQTVTVEFSVTFYPDPKSVNTVYKEVGDIDALVNKIIKPVALGSIKDAIGQVIADELVSKRENVRKQAYIEVSENLQDKKVIVTDLQFTNLDFDDAYEQAVEAKVVAVQNAQKAKNETVRIQEESNQKVIEAKATAEAMRIQSQALAQNKGLIEYEIAKKWDGSLPTMMMGNSVPLLNLEGFKKK